MHAFAAAAAVAAVATAAAANARVPRGRESDIFLLSFTPWGCCYGTTRSIVNISKGAWLLRTAYRCGVWADTPWQKKRMRW